MLFLGFPKKKIKITVEINEIKKEKQQRKVNETKTWFLEKINKLTNLASLIQRKRESQVAAIRNEGEDITTDVTEAKRITKECCELDTNKLDSLHEMDIFLKRHELLKLAQGKKDNRNGPITNEETELAVLRLPIKKSPYLDSFTAGLHRTLKGVIPILHKLIPKPEYFPTYFMRPELP